MAFARVCNLRCKPDTQWETQQIANLIDIESKQHFPTSWRALRHG
jgi:thymidylate synthase ThyX